MAVAFPFLNPVYIFGESYIIGQAEFGVWLAYHMGVVALASRVLMGREKLRPE
jgi:heme exporter protein D